MPRDEVVARISLKAAEVLRVGGHIKGIAYNQAGAHCALGALAKAMDQDNICTVPVMDVSAIIARAAGITPCPVTKYPVNVVAVVTDVMRLRDGIVQWNDAPERTAEEVICMFEQAAANLKED